MHMSWTEMWWTLGVVAMVIFIVLGIGMLGTNDGLDDYEDDLTTWEE